MSDNNTSALQKGLNAANTVRGAAKIGKSIAAASKGGAAGGWIGAAAAFAFENRKLLATITLGIVALMLLPIAVICMLPSIIFGGTDNTAINDCAVIEENVNTVMTSTENIFKEALNNITDEIDEDIATLPNDVKSEIIYPESSEENGLIILSQYCAAKNNDYEAVSVSDLESILEENKDRLYGYEKVEETRRSYKSVTLVDSESGEEKENIIEVEEKYTVYTVFNNGEKYFAENIFLLDDEQKSLAKDYYENLSIFLSGGI